jgi:Uma2 family endonuclease
MSHDLVTAHKRWTVADVDALPYDEWHTYELIDGTLYVWEPPHCDHQVVTFQITKALDDWSALSGLGVANFRVGVILSETDAVTPDVVWISHERFTTLLNEDGHLIGAPELVAEVLSPGLQHGRRDQVAKLLLYEKYGVQEYWIVDWQLQQVTIYRREQDALRLALTLLAGDALTSPLLPGFACPVARLFA